MKCCAAFAPALGSGVAAADPCGAQDARGRVHPGRYVYAAIMDRVRDKVKHTRRRSRWGWPRPFRCGIGRPAKRRTRPERHRRAPRARRGVSRAGPTHRVSEIAEVVRRARLQQGMTAEQRSGAFAYACRQEAAGYHRGSRCRQDVPDRSDRRRVPGRRLHRPGGFGRQ
jgi:hypothetical protein